MSHSRGGRGLDGCHERPRLMTPFTWTDDYSRTDPSTHVARNIATSMQSTSDGNARLPACTVLQRTRPVVRQSLQRLHRNLPRGARSSLELCSRSQVGCVFRPAVAAAHSNRENVFVWSPAPCVVLVPHRLRAVRQLARTTGANDTQRRTLVKYSLLAFM